MSRYEAFIMNGTNGAVETINLETLDALGGYYCLEDVARMSFDRGNIVARVYDYKTNKGFWLNNIEW